MELALKNQLDIAHRFALSPELENADETQIQELFSCLQTLGKEDALESVAYLNTNEKFPDMGEQVLGFLAPELRLDIDFLRQLKERGADTSNLLMGLDGLPHIDAGKGMQLLEFFGKGDDGLFSHLPTALKSNVDFLLSAREAGIEEYDIRSRIELEPMSAADKVRAVDLIGSTFYRAPFTPKSEEVIELIQGLSQKGQEGIDFIDSLDWSAAAKESVPEVVDILGAENAYGFLRKISQEIFDDFGMLGTLQSKGVNLSYFRDGISLDNKTVQEKIDALDYFSSTDYSKLLIPREDEVMPLVNGYIARGDVGLRAIGNVNWQNAARNDALQVIDLLGGTVNHAESFAGQLSPELLGDAEFLGKLREKKVSDHCIIRIFRKDMDYENLNKLIEIMPDSRSAIAYGSSLKSEQILAWAQGDANFLVNSRQFNFSRLNGEDGIKMMETIGFKSTLELINAATFGAIGNHAFLQEVLKKAEAIENDVKRNETIENLFSSFAKQADTNQFLQLIESHPERALEYYNSRSIEHRKISSSQAIFEKLYKLSTTDEDRLQVLANFQASNITSEENAISFLEAASPFVSAAYKKLEQHVGINSEVVKRALELSPKDTHRDIFISLRDNVQKAELASVDQARALRQLDPDVFAKNSKTVTSRDYGNNTYQYALFQEASEIFLTARKSYSNVEQLFSWNAAQKTLSKAKQSKQIPDEHIINAIGTNPQDIESFYNAQVKGGVFAALETMPFYQNSPEASKTDIIKLCAHLGCFETGNQAYINESLARIDKISSAFTSERIHSLFGSLPQGFALGCITARQDKIQGISPEHRSKFDATGKKAVAFFMKNLENPEFEKVSAYALTRFVRENVTYNNRKKDSRSALESRAYVEGSPRVRGAVMCVQSLHAEIADYIAKNNNKTMTEKEETRVRDALRNRVNSSKNSELSEYIRRNDLAEKPFGVEFVLQSFIEQARKILNDAIKEEGTLELQGLLEKSELAAKPFGLEHVLHSFFEVSFPNAKYQNIAEAAVKAGYGKGEEAAVEILCEIFEEAQKAPEKYFSKRVYDKQCEGITYLWAEVENPQLYTIAKAVDGTCMRPQDHNEAALWEVATSRDVKLAFILDEHKQPIAYLRANYDVANEGIYIDIVDSKKSIVSNNENVWEAAQRAVVDMAERMNEEGHTVRIINYRDDNYNKLQEQFNKLEPTRQVLRGREYRHSRAPHPYGNNEPRVQKEVWVNPKHYGGR